MSKEPTTVSDERMKLRVMYSRETDLIFSDNIPAYADWLEKKLAHIGTIDIDKLNAVCNCCGKELHATFYCNSCDNDE